MTWAQTTALEILPELSPIIKKDLLHVDNGLESVFVEDYYPQYRQIVPGCCQA